jgi:Uma2 family endonuclease
VLVIEVTWTTAHRDRQKAQLYASCGVPVYWRLDLEHRRLEVREQPTSDGIYTRVHVLGEDEEAHVPQTSTSWKVAELLPRT